MARTKKKGAPVSALQQGVAFLKKIHKTADPKDFGVVPADPNIYKMSLPHIPTGSIVVDYLIGGEPNEHGVAPCPGFPRGRVIQIWGHESSGKTTLALTAAATCIANGGTVLFVDFEQELVASYAKALGVPVEDQSKFLWIQPETLEMGFQAIKVMMLSGVDMVIVDSVGSAAPTALATRKIEDIDKVVGVGMIARGWNDFWNENKPILTKANTSFVALSQMRSIIGATGFQKKTKPQGGNVWKFISSIRVELARVGTEKVNIHDALTHKTDKRVMVGKIKAKVVKSKISMSAGNEAQFFIRWGSGIDDIRSLIEIGLAHHVIKKSGAYLKWTTSEGEEVSGQGKDKFRDKVLSDEKYIDLLYESVLPHLTNTTPADEDYDESLDEDEFEDAAVDTAIAALNEMVEDADVSRKGVEAKAVGFEPEDNEV